MPPKTRGRKPAETGIGDMFLQLSESISKQAREPNILAYKPHYKQQQFHMSTDKTRLYIGGNRSGKSFGAVAEDVWWCSHTHPYQKTPDGPIRGRVIAVDLMQGVNQIMLPIFARLMTPSMLINGSWEDSYSKSERILSFSNGSFIEFLSYEMETEKFAGTSRHFVHYDEEPPKHVYNESQARLIDTNGRAWISMTPLLGITWVHEEIFEPAVDAPDKEILVPRTSISGAVFRSAKRKTSVIEVSMNENPHLSEEAREDFLATLDEDERAAREKGQFITVGGKVFKTFDPATHVIPQIYKPAEELRGWEWYTSTDHGFNNPTAWLWHAVSPSGDVITFAEHYKDHWTIDQHAEKVYEIEAELGRGPDVRTGDPAMRQQNGVTGTSILQEYADRGLYIAVDSVPRSVDVGIVKMQEYFKVPAPGKKPRWVITANCVNFINELKKLRWDTYASKKQQFENNRKEGIKKKDDHAFDSARYFATFLPDLTPQAMPTARKTVSDMRGGQVLLYDQALNMAIDNAAEKDNSSEWTVLETYK